MSPFRPGSFFAVLITAWVLAAAPLLADDGGEERVVEDRTGQWHLSVYSGQAASDRLLDIITKYNTPFIDSYLVALSPGWVHRQTKNWRFEVEGQVVKHWGDFQDHWEFNGAYIARWMPFFWDHVVDTSFAVGAGVSYATEVPLIEPRAEQIGELESAKLLGYLMMEFEFSPPNDSPFAAFIACTIAPAARDCSRTSTAGRTSSPAASAGISDGTTLHIGSASRIRNPDLALQADCGATGRNRPIQEGPGHPLEVPGRLSVAAVRDAEAVSAAAEPESDVW
jgi:hypothetical protein